MDAREVPAHDLRMVGRPFRSKGAVPARPQEDGPAEFPVPTLAAPTAATHDRLRERLQRRPQT